MIRIEIEASIPADEGDVSTATMRLAQSLDLGDNAVIHRISVEQADA